MARTIPRRLPPVREVKIPDEKFGAILCADIHLRDDCPMCREPEEFMAAQRRKLGFIGALCQKSHCPLLCAGDFFDNWKPSPSLITMALELLPTPTIIVPGQHDLQNHDLKSLWRTGLGTLEAGGKGVILFSPGAGFVEGYKPIYTPAGTVYGLAYGQGLEDLPKTPLKKTVNILLWHHLTCQDKQPWPDAGAETSHALLKKLPAFDLVVTGDNHQQFYSGGTKGTLLCNPGSMTRQTADQVDFEPAVFGWNAPNNSLTRILLPIDPKAVRTGHLGGEKREDRDARMTAYVKRAARQYEARLSFTKNLEKHFKVNEEPKGVEEKTWKAVD